MTAALEGGEWSVARPGRTLPTVKTLYPFYRSLGGPQSRSGRVENLVPTGIPSRIVQPVVSHFTEWDTTLFIDTNWNQGTWAGEHVARMDEQKSTESL